MTDPDADMPPLSEDDLDRLVGLRSDHDDLFNEPVPRLGARVGGSGQFSSSAKKQHTPPL